MFIRGFSDSTTNNISRNVGTPILGRDSNLLLTNTFQVCVGPQLRHNLAQVMHAPNLLFSLQAGKAYREQTTLAHQSF